jgi:hypothetical protein
MDTMFAEINHTNVFYIKKTLRRILRITNKHIRYIGSKTAEVELLIYFCRMFKQAEIPVRKSVLLANMYTGQLKKTEKLISALHEDLQRDYENELKDLR